jgi:spore germination protein KA
MITAVLPSFYVALQSYHQEMIPTPLLISMSEGREGVPFPVFVEALLMGTIYEILREAGVRMPRPVGQAVSIVGALVIGEASVQAGLVSQTMVIVVALTAISGFVVPALADTAAILRLYFLLPAAVLGLFGWQMAFIALLIHLASLRSFGVPYTTPIMPAHVGELQDVFIRSPLWSMVARPALLSKGRRQGKNGWQLWRGGKKGK